MCKITLRHIFVSIVILLPLFLEGQTIITGLVKDHNGQPLPNTNISVYEKGSSVMLVYSTTNTSGNYKIEYKGNKDSIKIEISGFNIKKQSKIIANTSQKVNFVTVEELIQLNEVKITPLKIQKIGDTINYHVGSFTDKSDRTIGDVLKNMPGIEVKESGAILYQNRPINKFYIEDSDLLQGRYGLATSNIEAKDVSTVQVLENHQPIKALQDREFSEDAAINLKLKESAKGNIIANAQLGAGASPVLWDNELTAMYISKKLQNISTYKGNNSGSNIAKELIQLYSNSSGLNSGNLLSVQSPSNPGISEQRYLDNLSNMGSFNSLHPLGADYKLTTNINYLNDYQEKNSYSLSEYYLSNDSLLQIEELLSSRLRKEHLTGTLQLNANTSKFYLDNTVKIEGVWDRERGNAIGEDSVFQYLKTPNYELSNVFALTKVQSNKSWNFHSSNTYYNSSHTLNVSPVLYSTLFEPSILHKDMIQNLDNRLFTSLSRVGLSLGKSAFKQNYSLSFGADIQDLKSALHSDINNIAPDSLKNNLSYNKYEWIFRPGYTYSLRNLQLSFSIPISFSLLSTNNKVDRIKENNSFLYLKPSVNIHYKLSAYWNVSLNYMLDNSTGGINNAYTNYIMSSYRSLQNNNGELYKMRSQRAGLNLIYRNTLKSLFFNVNISYINSRNNLLYDYYYQDILKVISTVYIPNTSQRWNLFASINKSIDAINTTVFLTGNYSRSKSSQINQDEILDYINQSFSISPRVLTKIGSKISFTYQFTFLQSRNKIENVKNNFVPINRNIQKVQLNVFPTKNLIFILKYENFYNNSIKSGSRSMSFADISVKYKHKKIELTLDYNNIFNSKHFTSASYSDISRYYYSYNLRPAQVLLKARFKLK